MIDIYIKSYPKDFPYLYYCLRSIDKFLTGYNKIIIHLPVGSNTSFKPPVLPKGVEVIFSPEKGDGYMFQQYCKMMAYTSCKAPYIMYLDSDCVVNTPIDIKTLINEKGQPKILKTKYSKVGDAKCWLKPTIDYFLNAFPITHEYMRRNGMIFRRDTIEKVSAMKKDLLGHILSKRDRQFSEFNVIGAYADKFQNDLYNFVDTDNWEFEEHWMTQLWSWGDVNEELKKINGLLDE